MYFYTDSMPNGKKFEYTFLSDFDIADHFGASAIKDTYKRAFNEWKTDIKAIAEMSVALNMRCWFWYQKNEALCELYQNLFYKLQDYVYRDNTEYSEEELHTYWEYTD